MHRVAVIAHRGATAPAPENSLEAFRNAIEMGADMVEMDVRTTLDGVPVVMHDETIDRTANGSGRVSKMTLEALKGFVLRNSERVPTLAEALDAMRGKCRVNVELKDAGAVAPSCSIVLEMDMSDAVLFSSFDCLMLAAVKSRMPRARVAVISDDRRSGFIDSAGDVGAIAVNLSAKIASARVIGEAHRDGLAVNVWTVNRPDSMRKFIALGADGIITDRPDRLADIVRALRPDL